MSDYFIRDINSLVKIGEKIDLQILNINEEKKQLVLSHKSIMPKLLRDPFNYGIKETKNGFGKLKKETEIFIDKLKG
jgi:ribosomal protein S1